MMDCNLQVSPNELEFKWHCGQSRKFCIQIWRLDNQTSDIVETKILSSHAEKNKTCKLGIQTRFLPSLLCSLLQFSNQFSIRGWSFTFLPQPVMTSSLWARHRVRCRWMLQISNSSSTVWVWEKRRRQSDSSSLPLPFPLPSPVDMVPNLNSIFSVVMIIPTMMVTRFIIAVCIERVTWMISWYIRGFEHVIACNRCVVIIPAILAGVMEWTR